MRGTDPTVLSRAAYSVDRWRSSLKALVSSDFVHKVSETFATQLLLIVIGFATTVAVARSLGPTGRGIYATMVAVGALGVQFANLGLHVSNIYYVAKDRTLLSTLLGNAVLVSVVVGGFIAAVVALISTYFWPQIAPLQGPTLILAVSWIPLGLCYLLVRNLLLGMMEVRWYNKLELQNRIVMCCILAVLILSRQLTVATAFLAMTVGVIVSLIRGFWRLQRVAGRFSRPSVAVLLHNLPLGLRGYLTCLFSFMVLRIDLLMVKTMLGPEQTGYYSIAATLADYVLMLPAVIGSILFPRLSAQSDHTAKLRFSNIVTLGSAALLLPLVIVCGLSARIAIHLVFGKAFEPAALAFVYLLPGVFLLGVQTVAVQFLNSIGYPKIVIGAWALTTVLNVGLNFWVIPRYGIVGASTVSSITYSAVCLFVLIIISRYRESAPSTAGLAVDQAS